MNQILIAVLGTACFVRAVDLVTTHVRKRARASSVTPEPPLTEEDLGDEPEEGVALEQE